MFARLVPLLLLLLVTLTLAEDKAAKDAKDAKEGSKDANKDAPKEGERSHDRDHDDDDDDDDDDDKKDGDHDQDHEAFLGRDESHRFDDLTPKQAQNALLEMLPRIDSNADGNVTVDEMQAYLAAVAKRERRLSSDKRFDEIKLFNHALDVNAPMTFDEYKNALHHATVGDREGSKKAVENFNNQLVRSQARWAKADVDGDKALSKAEFADFLRPEESPHMRDIVIQEAMMSADKNKDGKIDLNEYMSELRPSYEADVKNKKRLPRWVEKEEKRFKETLDANKDGALDPSEVYKWIVPEDIDHSRKETAHLFKLADKDNNKQLTREEILNKWSNFVGHRDESPYSHEEL